MKKGDIKWDPLWKNFKNFQPAWRHLTLKAFLIGFVAAIFKFGLSCSDLGGDAYLAYNYIHGDTYMYFFTNMSDELITSMNCTFRNETLPGVNGVQTPMYDCFVHDIVTGYLSLAFTMTPGLLSAYFVGQKLWKNSTSLYFLVFVILIPVHVVLSPFMIIVVKVSIFSELIQVLEKTFKNPCLDRKSNPFFFISFRPYPFYILTIIGNNYQKCWNLAR